jgi:bifunctional UDP-N-acetylglucosamine pyrophosphorylase/glucosamine-1-phosphate N-acetyltransferase
MGSVTGANGSNGGLAVVLAAGQGTRMRSTMPKVLHPVAGLPMVCHAMDAATGAGLSNQAVVVGYGATDVQAAVQSRFPAATFHEQKERLGTAHAVLAAKSVLQKASGPVVVLYGDVPLIRPETIARALAALKSGAALAVLGFHAENPSGYGRLLMDGGTLLAIREEKDASEEERRVTFCNSGIIAFGAGHSLSLLEKVGSDNAQGEYYLTDVVEVAREQGLQAVAIACSEAETMGVNDRVQLAKVEELWQGRRRDALMVEGVSMTAPQTVFFHHDTAVEADVVIEPNVVFGPGVEISSGAIIRAFSHLEGSQIGPGAFVGPYARLRPGTKLEMGAKIGNFVETKNAQIAEGAKVNHLTYIGDATVGAAANIGAGTVTCNYDGFNKHRTEIGAGAFIGSNTALIAPVTIGADANIAAGSAVSKDVPADALALTRTPQSNLEGMGKKLRARYAAAKKSKG